MNINGKANLCPGCPVTGNFVGEVKPESQQFGKYENPNRHSMFSVGVTMEDIYGMRSETVKTDHDLDEQGAKVALSELHNGATESLCDRVKSCVGYTAVFTGTTQVSREQRKCPAINPTILNQLRKES